MENTQLKSVSVLYKVEVLKKVFCFVLCAVVKILVAGRLYPSHGDVVEDGAGKLREYRKHRAWRENIFMDVLRQEWRVRPERGGMTAWELCCEVYARRGEVGVTLNHRFLFFYTVTFCITRRFFFFVLHFLRFLHASSLDSHVNPSSFADMNVFF